ncbi:hypothetical protein BBO99_00001966 [Phytophthora kernoviae]|uniref:Trafficking protein particle complex subunit 11 domain-containing protein n=2 Tax=Phytophthora kernoviae TaxID=325452 RepID=A0A3R7J8B7_9STRA|nr:hypothetical protein G195_002515 [Phytophthora kernoviae 00238/432]KAG2530156.1 hypothetical protein JM16_001647 [Phytophthora kernoviae]KAG2530300.1 hypothetical protein JM18_001817 [Phytophthora kernoviae]RLN20229.1 hypothetical protein BBI17_001984 [Phytophthora kernoviae]RLN83573.1 hypothetical protein BBO99_00001966 [Phytophthora kernoviae]
MESFGTELKETPYPLIASLGSRELQSKVLPQVRAVNEEFVPKLHFASLPREHRFPGKKELREKHGTFPNQTQRDFEGYRTQGILKARWIKKHHELLPAVVLLFDEFDPRWSPQDWQVRETALREEIEQLKRTVSARECRVVLVLMQQVDDAGVAPMNTTEERLMNLRKKLDTDAKGLVLLRSRDLVRGSSVLAKFESTVRNMALEYYKAQSKRVKRYKKALAKTTGYQALHARLSFKIAHYYEFRRYTTKVLQHYEASYRAIIALPLNESERTDGISYSQVMTMAEFVNFKLCYHLIFSSTNIKGAVDQLHRHMGMYARAIVVADRAYEHWEWVSRQYHVFAQLLAEATSIRGSLPSTGMDSDVYKEPYLYFATAAKYAMFRRKAAAKLGLTAATTVPTATTNGEVLSERDFVVVPSVFIGVCSDGTFFMSLEFTNKTVKEIRVPLHVLDGRQMLSFQEAILGAITCTSAEPLKVLALEFEPHATDMTESLAVSGFGPVSPALVDDRPSGSSTKDVCATFNEGDSRCFCLRLVPKVASNFVTLGRVKVIWQRVSSTITSPDGGPRNDVVSTWLEIPMVSFVDAPLAISVETPSFGVEGVVVYMDVRVKNTEAIFHSLRVKPVDAEGSFFISGRTNATEDLLPYDERVFRMGLVPTKTGYLRLPRLEIVSLTYNLPFTNSDERQELFVLPRECPDWELAS